MEEEKKNKKIFFLKFYYAKNQFARETCCHFPGVKPQFMPTKRRMPSKCFWIGIVNLDQSVKQHTKSILFTVEASSLLYKRQLWGV